MRKTLFGFALLTSLSCGGANGSPTAPSPAPPVSVVPMPAAPLAGASMANACSGGSWQFDWSDVQASAYHLQVFSPSGTAAVDVADTPASVYTWNQPPLVTEADRLGWKWRVRALVGGTWRDWTSEIPFEVDPLSPRLIAPPSGGVADNGCRSGADGIAWDFEWSACRGADRYHLFVIGASAAVPVVDDDRLEKTSYESRQRAWIAPGNDRDWSWRVRARIDGTWRDWSAGQVFAVEPVDTDCAALPPPAQIAPPDGAVFDHFPRTTTLEWGRMSQAASYGLDVEICQNPACSEDRTNSYGPIAGLTSPAYTVNFVGAQPGRWRVWAVNGAGVAGPKSGWWEFRYTR